MSIKTQVNTSFENTSVAFSSKTDGALRKMYWLFFLMNIRFLVKIGTSFIQLAFFLRLPIKWLIKRTIFSQFCGGESIQDSDKTIQKLHEYHIGTILDYSVEGEKNEEGFEHTTREIIKTIDKAALNPDKIPFCVFKVTGIAPFALLEKKQSQEELTEKERRAWRKVKKRMEIILGRAFERKVRIFIDAEESWIQKTIDELAYEMMEYYNEQEALVYNTYQMYCRDSYSRLQEAYQRAQEYGYFLGVKLVRGAYMEKERVRAQAKAYPDPIQPDKKSTDEDYNRALDFCVQHRDKIALCAGTHNEESNYYLISLMEQYNIAPNDPHFYFSQLYGMSDHISYNLAKDGYNVAKYVPYGPVASVLPYLFRRAEENTAVAGQSSREYNLIKTEIKRRRSSLNR
ncbi:MAG: proline dehydrogenase family protein [Microscillaceae bacterium]|nr:proline dehydrogenase family protein [Microscillaceae bacterium]